MSNEPDEVNSGAITVAILLTAFTTLCVALVVTALVREETKSLLDVKDLTQETQLRELKAAHLAELNGAPAWKDKGAALVSVPIERAMAEVAEAIRANPLLLSPGKPPEEEDEGAEGDESEDESSEADEDGSEETDDDQKKPAPAPSAPVNGPTVPAKSPAVPVPAQSPVAPKSPVAPGPKAPAPQPKAPGASPAPAPGP